MDITIPHSDALVGKVRLPADKSISHRAALFAGLARGQSVIRKFSRAADPRSTLSCLRQMGVSMEEKERSVTIYGKGRNGLSEPTQPVDCGNSGTTMRLLSGILAGQTFSSTLVGDESLTSRPMERIARPLRKMGANIELTDGHAPVHIIGDPALRGIEYELPVPSAQVKSCVLLAGLFAEGTTTVIETIPSRDHTERMLGIAPLEKDDRRYLTVEGGTRVQPQNLTIPRDFSAAAYFIVAGSIVDSGELQMNGVGLNPSRTALLDVLDEMGANIEITNESTSGEEPVGDLTIYPGPLTGTTIKDPLIPNLIDEVPILAVAACCADGRTEIRDAEELRVKETDRIHAMVTNLEAMGVEVEEFEDGLAIEGPQKLAGRPVHSFGDHRIAMSMGIAGLVAGGQTTIENAECAEISFPAFWDVLKQVRT